MFLFLFRDACVIHLSIQISGKAEMLYCWFTPSKSRTVYTDVRAESTNPILVLYIRVGIVSQPYYRCIDRHSKFLIIIIRFFVHWVVAFVRQLILKLLMTYMAKPGLADDPYTGTGELQTAVPVAVFDICLSCMLFLCFALLFLDRCAGLA